MGVAQVAQAVAPDARREQPVELGLGLARLAGRRGGDAPGGARLRAVGGGRVEGFHGASIAKPAAKKFRNAGRVAPQPALHPLFPRGIPMITNPQSGTNVHEIADGIYRINTPIDLPGGQAFSFNQYLVVDDEPLLFHTGPRQLFPLVREAIAAVMPVERLRYVGLSHFEADECGALNELARARRPRPCRCAARSPRWCRSTTSPTGRRARWPTASSSRSAATRCSGSTRRTCRTAGTAAC